MAKENAVRILVIEDSANEAENFLKAARSVGFAVRPQSLRAEDKIAEVLQQHQPHIIFFSYKNKTVPSLSELKVALEKTDSSASVIVICDTPEQLSIIDALKNGACDRIIRRDLDHLTLVVKREFERSRALKDFKVVEKLYKEAEARNHALMDNSRDAIAYVHVGMHVYANKAYLELLGFAAFDDIEGLPIMDLVISDQQETFKKFLRGLDEHSDKAIEYETRLTNTQNNEFRAKMEFSPASIEGEPCTQIIIRQQTDSKELEEQIHKLSKLDPLTGLLNRQAFLEKFGKVIPQVTATKQLTLALLGIDNFKQIQEVIGLVGSDQVLSDIADLIKRNISEQDLAGRHEGGKYLILLPHGNEAKLKMLSDKLIKVIGEQISSVGSKSVTINASLGASIVDDAELDVNEGIARAEKAYNTAVEEGGNRLATYRPKEGEMTQKQMDAAWVKRLKAALDEKRFHLLYQPIVQLDGGTMERYEVFMEMRNEKGERVSTGDFLPAAERTKMSKVLDRWVISNALGQLTNRLKTRPNTVFFVKLTGGSLEDKELFRWIGEKTKAADLPKGRLIFEVKEEAVITHLKLAQAFATLLKTIHCGFAIDDFGKGPDPFKLLTLVPAQFLKFDKDFTQDLSRNEQNQETLKEITAKAQELKKYTIVQHVEDAASLSVLWVIGANFTQGNFFQGPSDTMDYDFSSGLT
ncbi:MAG: EAL domain-containing protein [Gammaproteobacteria bacterium]|nr:EAL domain-containing protein [Gammaproteobacteria bacterium]